MTIVVWDGNLLATDKAATDGAVLWEAVKAWYGATPNGRPCVISGVGPLRTIHLMREWYRQGPSPSNFPLEQLTLQFCQLLVVDSAGLWRYEQSPYPIEHGRLPCAFGEGRDIALGALAMGASAERAVEIVNQHSPFCGLGVALWPIAL